VTRRRFISFVVFIAVASSGGPARAQTGTITLDAYAARLNAAIVSLQSAPADTRSTAAVDAAIGSIGLPVGVRLPDGTVVVVTVNSLLGDTLGRQGGPTIPAVLGRLRAALADAHGASAVAPVDRGAIDRALSDAYGDLTPKAATLPERVISSVRQAIGWFLDRTVGALLRSSSVTVVAWGVVLAMLLAGVWFLRRFGAGVVPGARWSGGDGTVTRIDWKRAAEEALARGDLDEAVRARYHLLLIALSARGIVEDAPSLTAGECRLAVATAEPELAKAVTDATATFERVAYGAVPADRDDVETLTDAERRVRRT